VEKQRSTTYIAFDIFVGADTDQQPHTVRSTAVSGTFQRRVAVLGIVLTATGIVNKMWAFREKKQISSGERGRNTDARKGIETNRTQDHSK
jgi:hypothetical protein